MREARRADRVSRREKRNITRIFGVALLTSALLTGGLTSASAASTAISGTYAANQTAYWGTIRYNNQQLNKVSVYVNSYTGNAGIYFGIRNSAGTTLGTTNGIPGQWRNMLASNGSGAMPRGGFYMNSLINSYCANPGCSMPSQTFNAQLRWDISW